MTHCAVPRQGRSPSARACSSDRQESGRRHILLQNRDLKAKKGTCPRPHREVVADCAAERGCPGSQAQDHPPLPTLPPRQFPPVASFPASTVLPSTLLPAYSPAIFGPLPMQLCIKAALLSTNPAVPLRTSCLLRDHPRFPPHSSTVVPPLRAWLILAQALSSCVAAMTGREVVRLDEGKSLCSTSNNTCQPWRIVGKGISVPPAVGSSRAHCFPAQTQGENSTLGWDFTVWF